LRKLAKELSGSKEAEKFLNALPHTYLEENHLHGFLIEHIKDYEECLNRTKQFLPYVDNWATCDSFNPKVFAKHKDELITEIGKWLDSGKTYTIRFGIVNLMRHYKKEGYDHQHLYWVRDVDNDDYYVMMAKAWYYATIMVDHFDDVLDLLENKQLKKEIHNKTISKAIDSYRIDPKQKAFLKTLVIR
jgi:3-methyladenine DNA glycosylase AlkD